MVIQVDMNFLNSYVSMVKLKCSVMEDMSLKKMGMKVLNFDMDMVKLKGIRPPLDSMGNWMGMSLLDPDADLFPIVS